MSVTRRDAIVLDQVTKKYGNVQALKGISLRIEKGEFVFIVGGSGAGKSTLTRLLFHEVEATTGKVYVLGQDMSTIKHKDVPYLRRKLGIVFQNYRLLKDMNVYENVAFAQHVAGVPDRQIRRNVPEILSKVGLAGKYKAKPKQLSGGEQQRVAIARALVNQPEILLCDEPTGNLDPAKSWEIMQLLEEINAGGTTVIVVTHNKEIVDTMQKRVITLEKGLIVSDKETGGYLDENE